MTVYINGVTIAVGASVSAGNYAGDSSVNRAIPHGLGVVPKLVYLTDTGTYWFCIYGGIAKVLYQQTSLSGQQAVTAPDAVNFYVGNAADYLKSANGGANYYWVALSG